jgi:hypothetical protein
MDKIQKEKLIKKEMGELNKNFKDVPKEAKTYIDRLIREAAFMRVILLELQDILSDTGAVEEFKNGSQQMLREHPAAKTYNTMIKNYQSVIKQLSEVTPEQPKDSDLLTEFLKKAKK